jgi:predicted PurR-regulated permease PerM
MINTTGLTPAVRILLLAAGAAVTLWGMSNYAAYINSAVLAILIVLACGPLIDWLRRRGLPKWAALLITLVVSLAVLGLFVVFLIYAAVEFAQQLPTYQEQAQALVQDFEAWLQSLGLQSAGANAVATEADPSAALTWVSGMLSSLASAAGNMVTLSLLMIFLFVDVVLFPGRLDWQATHGNSYARRLAEFTGGLRQYVVVMAIIGTVIGTLNTVMFFLLGVPMPLLWGVLSGILNFIPFIGFWFGLIPPAILTLLEYGPQRMLVLATLYILVNAFTQNVIQPRLVVVRLNLTPFMNLLSSTFWPLVLGPVGAIIGVPLTMAVRSLLFDADPSTRWIGDLMGTTLPDQPARAQAPPKTKKAHAR